MNDSFTDQLSIETPEQVELHFPIAGVGSRFLALLVDSLLQLATLILLFVAFQIFAYTAGPHGGVEQLPHSQRLGEKWAIAFVIFFFFLLYWGYFTLFEGLWQGQTPGKRMLKVRVIKDSGRQITLFESMARNLLRVVDMQLSYLVGVAAMLCNRQQKRLGDLVAGTIVVHDRTEEQPMVAQHRTFTASLYAEPGFSEPTRRGPRGVESEPLAGDAVARLGRKDLHVIETFFGRALDLSLETRAAMAQRIAVQMAGKMGMEVPDAEHPERFLEAVAFAMRRQGRSGS